MYMRLGLLSVAGYLLSSVSLPAAEQSSSSLSSVVQKDFAGGASQLEHEESEKKKSAEASDNQWELQCSLKEHTDTILSLEFYGSGLTSGSQDLTAKVWDVGAGKLLYTLEPTYVTQSVTYPGKQGEPDRVEEVRTRYVPRACAARPAELVILKPLYYDFTVHTHVMQTAGKCVYDQSVIIKKGIPSNQVLCGVIPAPTPSWIKVSALAFDESGDVLAVGYGNGQIDIWRQKVVSKALLQKDLLKDKE